MKHVSKNLYKRVLIIDYFTTRKRKILMDKRLFIMELFNNNFCNKCQLERINNRAEECYVCMKCGD